MTNTVIKIVIWWLGASLITRFPDDQDIQWNTFEYEWIRRTFLKTFPMSLGKKKEWASIPVSTLPTIGWVGGLME